LVRGGKSKEISKGEVQKKKPDELFQPGGGGVKRAKKEGTQKSGEEAGRLQPFGNHGGGFFKRKKKECRERGKDGASSLTTRGKNQGN